MKDLTWGEFVSYDGDKAIFLGYVNESKTSSYVIVEGHISSAMVPTSKVSRIEE